jgi:hypothetical protein
MLLVVLLLLQVNKAEQERLRQEGAQLAPVGFHLQGPAKPQEMGVGPLRMWPGGLCVSRYGVWGVCLHLFVRPGGEGVSRKGVQGGFLGVDLQAQ